MVTDVFSRKVVGWAFGVQMTSDLVIAALDLRNEKITYKIREHSMQKLPYILVAGDKEKAAGAVAVRARGNRDLGVMSVDAFIELIANDIATKA